LYFRLASVAYASEVGFDGGLVRWDASDVGWVVRAKYGNQYTKRLMQGKLLAPVFRDTAMASERAQRRVPKGDNGLRLESEYLFGEVRSTGIYLSWYGLAIFGRTAAHRVRDRHGRELCVTQHSVEQLTRSTHEGDAF
jgi:hypothetical protein